MKAHKIISIRILNLIIILTVRNSFAGPIHDAAERGDLEAVRIELSNGEQVTAKDMHNWTPLHTAVRFNHEGLVKLLIASGANVNEEGGWQKGAPLHWASLAGRLRIVELMISNGANVNAKAKNGGTPLDWARIEGNKQVADLIYEHGGKTEEQLKFIPLISIYKNDNFAVDSPFGIIFFARKGMSYSIEGTEDLLKWNKLKTIKGSGSEEVFTDTREAIFGSQFYRVKLAN